MVKWSQFIFVYSGHSLVHEQISDLEYYFIQVQELNSKKSMGKMYHTLCAAVTADAKLLTLMF